MHETRNFLLLCTEPGIIIIIKPRIRKVLIACLEHGKYGSLNWAAQNPEENIKTFNFWLWSTSVFCACPGCSKHGSQYLNFSGFWSF